LKRTSAAWTMASTVTSFAADMLVWLILDGKTIGCLLVLAVGGSVIFIIVVVIIGTLVGESNKEIELETSTTKSREGTVQSNIIAYCVISSA